MTRRLLILGLAPLTLAAFGSEKQRVRGRLGADASKPPELRLSDGRVLALEADGASMAVLRDERVIKEVFEAVGESAGADRFRIDPIHQKAMFVVRDGKPLVITYWCAVCAIRTYSPGKCQCCQEETELDPREPSLESGGTH